MSWLWLPAWEPTLIALVLLGCAGVSVLRAWRERRGLPRGLLPLLVLLRLTVWLLLAMIALNPTAVLPRPRAERPHLAVLLDHSASMAVGDVDGTSRFQAAGSALAAIWPRWQEHFTCELHRFGRQVQAARIDDLATDEATDTGTDLGGALATLIDHQAGRGQQAGIVLVSDGRETAGDGEEAASLALARGVPLWTVALGGPVERRDVELRSGGSEVLAFSGEEVAIAATLHQIGYPHRIFPVEVRDGDTLVETLEIRPEADGSGRILTRVTAPEAGEQDLRLIVPPQPGEADLSNNERSVHIRVVPGPVRVLVVEGQPHWDSKFLVQSLARHPLVSVRALYRLGEDRTFTLVEDGDPIADAQAGFPADAAALTAFDAVFIGRGCDDLLDDQQQALLRDFVAEHGGSLVFHRGRPYDGRMPGLARLEPVLWGGETIGATALRLSERGRHSPLFDLDPGLDPEAVVARMRPLDSVQTTRGLKPLAVALAHAEGDDGPIVAAWQPYGQGRVFTLNAGGLWRWGFHGQRNAFDEAVYDRLWSGLLRWLQSGGDFLAGHDIALILERRLINDEEPLRLEIRSRLGAEAGYRPRLRIHSAAGSAEVEPAPAGDGRFRAEAGPFPPGAATVELINSVGRPERIQLGFTVISASLEHRDLSADPELLATLAKISDGAALPLASLADLPRLVRAWQQRQDLADDRTPLWPRAWLLGCIVALLGLEWWLRRRGGLV